MPTTRSNDLDGGTLRVRTGAFGGYDAGPPGTGTLEQFPKSLSVIAGHSPSKTGVRPYVPAISITGALAILIEMAGTSPAMTTRGVNLIGKRYRESHHCRLR
jgi:hypothetical protein